jgi:hypothetical protein
MVSTSIVNSIATKAAALPIEMQREVLNFVEFLSLKAGNGATFQPSADRQSAAELQPAKTQEPTEQTASGDVRKPPFRSVMGALARPGLDVTPEDIAEVRREMRAEENADKPKPPIRNIIGMFDHLGINITEEDIAEARLEMWGNFPREEPR